MKDYVGSERKNVGLDVLFGLPAAETGVDRDLRKLVGAHNTNLCSCGVDALDRQLQIVVLLQGCADQFLQLGIVEHLPPRQIGERFGLGLSLLRVARAVKRRRCLYNGPVIVGADCAGRQQRRSSGNRSIVEDSHINLLEPVKAKVPCR